ncbi:MAG TPA: glycosyltransferase, partial [Candidatus Elarobacter sp.]|nr:glycosyltransferase [Candidatus Elarobacter sp.]
LRDAGVDFTCTLAGEGELRESIAGQIKAAGLEDRVRLAGAIPHDALLERLERGEFDVSVIASLEAPGGLMEGVPVALIEAMAAGTVVVATASGSIGELVDETTGVLVPHSDPPALADALGRAARDPALRERLRAAARARVEREYDADRTSAVLRGLIIGVGVNRPGYSGNESDTCLEGACGASTHGR